MRLAARLRRHAHQLVGAALASTVFCATFAVSLILHGDLPTTRRTVSKLVTGLLASLFEGKIVVGEIEHIGFDGVVVRDAAVLDPTGRRVIAARGVHAQASVLGIVRSLALGDELAIVVDDVRVDEADVVLDAMPTGVPRVAAAFLPKVKPAPPEPPKPPVKPPRRVRVELSRIVVGRGTAHGEPSAGASIDAIGVNIPARVLVIPEGVYVDVERFGLRTKGPLPWPATGTGEYHLKVKPGAPADVDMTANFSGEIAAATVVVSAELHNRQLRARVDAPKVTARELATLLPDVAIVDAVSLQAKVEGPLPDLKVELRGVTGPGEVTASGDLRVALPLTAKLDVSVRDLDPRSLAASAPAVSVGGDARVGLEIAPPHVSVDVEAKTFPFTYGEQSVPGATVAMQVRDRRVTGHATVHEAGLPTEADFVVEPWGAVSVDAEVDAPQLAEAPRLLGKASGAAKAKIKARYEKKSLSAEVEATVRGVGAGSVRLSGGRVWGKAFGPVDDLSIDAALKGSGLSLGGQQIEGVEATARGKIREPRVTVSLLDGRWSKLTAEASVGVGKAPKIEQVKASLTRGGVESKLAIGAIDVGGGHVGLRGVELSGAASFKGDVTVGPDGVSTKGKGEVAVSELAKAFPEVPLTGGRVSFDAELSRGAKRAGHLRFSVDKLQVGALPLLLSARGDLAIDNDEARGPIEASVTAAESGLEIAQATIDANGVALPQRLGAATRESMLRDLSGEVVLRTASVHIDNLYASALMKAARIAFKGLPALQGEAHLSGKLSRKKGETWPSGALKVRGWDIEATTRAPFGGNGTWHVTPFNGAIDLAFDAERQGHDGEAPSMAFDLQTRFGDEQGQLVELKAKTALSPRDLVTLSTKATPTGEREAALARVLSATHTATLSISERELTRYPTFMRVPSVRGKVAGQVSTAGPINDPTVSFAVRGEGVTYAEVGFDPWPVDATISGSLGPKGGSVISKITHQGGGEEATLRATARLRPGDFLFKRPDADKWTVDAEVGLRSFSLGALPFLPKLGVTGKVSGNFKVRDLHGHPEMSADISLEDAKLLDAKLSTLRVQGWLSERAGAVTVYMQQPPSEGASRGGMMQLTVLPALRFEQGIVPLPDARKQQVFALRLENFDVEPFSPLVTSLLSDLRGHLDGEVALTLKERTSLDVAPPTELRANLRWSNGVLLIPQIGQTFSKGSFKLTTEAARGRTLVHVRDISLSGTSGKAEGTLEASVPNAYLAYLVLADFPRADEARNGLSARGHLAIAKQQQIPITLEGVPLGDAHGQVDAELVFRDNEIFVDVALPRLVFDLPDSQRRDKPVQDIAENPDIGIIDQAVIARKRRRKQGALPLTVNIGLAYDLADLADPHRDFAEPPKVEDMGGHEVVVRRASVDVQLRGKLTMVMRDETRLTGIVHTVSGRVTALGKPFDIQSGYAQFLDPEQGGGADNPYINVTAQWDAPDGTQVFTDVTGFLKSLKVRLRSNPPRSESEVTGLVLFGRDTTQSQLPGQQTNQNMAVTSGVASTLLNSVFDPVNVLGRRLETRVDNSASRGTSIGVAAEIRPRLWAQVDVSTSKPQDRQNTDVSALTLDWRFRNNWSLRTTVGDRGSSTVELLWQFRY